MSCRGEPWPDFVPFAVYIGGTAGYLRRDICVARAKYKIGAGNRDSGASWCVEAMRLSQSILLERVTYQAVR